MKNADTPAMPQSATEIGYGCNYGNGKGEVAQGLTKREMFAMHAPEVPDWYEREFARTHFDNKDYYNIFTDEFAEICPTVNQEILPLGRMALIKEWRYAYADAMLGD